MRPISWASRTASRWPREHGDAVRGGLALKKVGNALMTLLGGREIHPVNVRVGGFYRVPDAKEFLPVTEQLKRARDLAVDTLRWVAQFPFPDYERDYEFVALHHPDEYPINEGRIVSNRGLDIAIADYESEFEERHVAHSTSLQSVLKRRGSYLVGPMARYDLNFDRLPAGRAGAGPRGRAWAGLPQSVSKYHRALGRDWSMPATRRCG